MTCVNPVLSFVEWTVTQVYMESTIKSLEYENGIVLFNIGRCFSDFL